jgi:hypothetical protein
LVLWHLTQLKPPSERQIKSLAGRQPSQVWAHLTFLTDINIVAVVGDDFPQSEIEDLNKHNVDTEGLQIKQGEKSFFWSGRYHNDMNSRDTLVTELNVLADFDPIIPESYQDCEYLMLGNLSPQVQQSVIKRLKNRPSLL